MQLLLIALSYNVNMLLVNLPLMHAFNSQCQVYFSCAIHPPPLMRKVLRVHSVCPLYFQVVGVADPRKFAQTKLQQRHKISEENIFEGWQPEK